MTVTQELYNLYQEIAPGIIQTHLETISKTYEEDPFFNPIQTDPDGIWRFTAKADPNSIGRCAMPKLSKFLVERIDRADGYYRFEAFNDDEEVCGLVVSEPLDDAVAAMKLAAKLNETANQRGRLLPHC